ALDAAHRRGLVHRDVKPSNVLIDDQDGREHCYLADFGLTQSASDTGPTDGHGLGTIAYVSPEQIRGETLDGRADQYALGCLLFESLTGSLPFGRGSDVAALFAHLEDPAPHASDLRPELGADVDQVLARALAKNREDRYGSCAELVEEARRALGLVAPAERQGRRLILVGVLAAVLAAVVAAAVVVLTRENAAGPVSGGALVGIDPGSNSVTSVYPVSAHPGVITAANGRVWASDFRDGSLWRLEPRSGDLQRFTTTGEPRDITSLGDDIYVASDGETILDGSVTRYDASTGSREGGVKVLACSVAAGLGVVWTAGCPFIERLSTDDGPFRIVREVRIPFQEPQSAETYRFAIRDMAVGEGALWLIGDPVDKRVFRVDPGTGDILGVTKLPFSPRAVAAGEGAVWVTGGLDDVVARLDAATGAILGTTSVPNGAGGVAAGAGGVWVASALARTVSRLEPRTGEVSATIPVDGAPREVAVGAGGVWVTTDAG
ncbi:MAG TPA: serine/threonine-protein kinase, partial [Gaiellaceae bacterium]|nr:serine/threonine-protein kinase [Gaiellaceae bacterium]